MMKQALRSNHRWLRLAVAAITSLALTASIAGADEQKWEQQIADAVAAGEISKEEGAEKLAYLKAGKHKHNKKSKDDTHLWEVWGKLQAAVKAGELTQAEAEAKMTAYKKSFAAGKKDKPAKAKTLKGDEKLLVDFWNELQAKVKAGEITQDEAVKIMSEIKSQK